MGKKPVLSAEREAEFIALFPHHSDADLAMRFGLTVRQAHHIGAKNGVHKTAATRSTSRRKRNDGPVLTVCIEALVVAAGSAGLTRTSIEAVLPDVSPSSITNAVNKLTAESRIHRAGAQGKSRWFGSATDAKSFRAALFAPAPKPARAATAPIKPSAGPALQPGAIHIPEGIEVQRGATVPGPDGRRHINVQPHFAGRIGRYDDDANGRWSCAATTRQASPGTTQELAK